MVFEEGGETREVHVVSGDTGSFGSNPMEQFIGLGQATVVRELEVIWPNREQTRQIFYNLPVDKTLRIIEGEEGWAEVDQKPFSLLVD